MKRKPIGIIDKDVVRADGAGRLLFDLQQKVTNEMGRSQAALKTGIANAWDRWMTDTIFNQ
ncbi:hypothetical protein [Negadavirga shengliensis]|uniref:Uncharacterized protein n=1 Tax=Negadavirga shengliensis TaxID=1389218 RepID=A0ABV9T7U4_9BACT